LRTRTIWIGAGLLAAALATSAIGQTPAAAAPGEAIYAARCKECHESGDERAPTRAQLAAKPAADILAALTTGPMAPMAEGLTPAEKQAVAVWLATPAS
jgi:polyvinyl alcohol dehydrogenase (cytochrome)